MRYFIVAVLTEVPIFLVSVVERIVEEGDVTKTQHAPLTHVNLPVPDDNTTKCGCKIHWAHDCSSAEDIINIQEDDEKENYLSVADIGLMS